MRRTAAEPPVSSQPASRAGSTASLDRSTSLRSGVVQYCARARQDGADLSGQAWLKGAALTDAWLGGAVMRSVAGADLNLSGA